MVVCTTHLSQVRPSPARILFGSHIDATGVVPVTGAIRVYIEGHDRVEGHEGAVGSKRRHMGSGTFVSPNSTYEDPAAWLTKPVLNTACTARPPSIKPTNMQPKHGVE